MTWTAGIPLSDYFEHIRSGRRPAVDAAHAVRLIHGLANAVCKLHHSLQIVHGDIQPANIVVTSHPSRFVLIDFGTAWTTDHSTARSDVDGYHRCYAAPELQTGDARPAFPSDQFSVSVVLYQLLTGVLPYGGLGGKAGRPELVARAGDSLVPPSRISRTCSDLPRFLRTQVDDVTLRGLALDPDQRYPDRHAWLEDLFRLSATLRLPPQPSYIDRVVSKVAKWFGK